METFTEHTHIVDGSVSCDEGDLLQPVFSITDTQSTLYPAIMLISTWRTNVPMFCGSVSAVGGMFGSETQPRKIEPVVEAFGGDNSPHGGQTNLGHGG